MTDPYHIAESRNDLRIYASNARWSAQTYQEREAKYWSLKARAELKWLETLIALAAQEVRA
jgi:hypothetical protein